MRDFQFSLRPRLPKCRMIRRFYIGSVTQQRIASSASVVILARTCSSFLVARNEMPVCNQGGGMKELSRSLTGLCLFLQHRVGVPERGVLFFFNSQKVSLHFLNLLADLCLHFPAGDDQVLKQLQEDPGKPPSSSLPVQLCTPLQGRLKLIKIPIKLLSVHPFTPSYPNTSWADLATSPLFPIHFPNAGLLKSPCVPFIFFKN